MNRIHITIDIKDASKLHDIIRLVLGLKGSLHPGIDLDYTVEMEDQDEPF